MYLLTGTHIRRADLQGRNNDAGGGRAEARDNLAGVRGPVKATTVELPMDVQQLGRADECPGESLRTGATPAAGYHPLARLEAQLHTRQRHGLRDHRLLG